MLQAYVGHVYFGFHTVIGIFDKRFGSVVHSMVDVDIIVIGF